MKHEWVKERLRVPDKRSGNAGPVLAEECIIRPYVDRRATNGTLAVFGHDYEGAGRLTIPVVSADNDWPAEQEQIMGIPVKDSAV